jgi:hypothetical protein
MKNSPPPRLAAGEDLFPEQPVTAFSRGPARRPAGPHQPPATSDESEQRYWACYGMALVEALLGPQATPQTVEAWYDLALQTREALGESTRERLARQLEAAADLLRWEDHA